ncbi:MAG TPA: glycoside hydrolase family 3 C-terminal domain-containing protein, partial [Chitinophagaceae bacterium]|nr:glycoside hydrolase family 3 C-terminal domain-containing protein [Chitinophagaceae bacterium]
RNEWGFRGAVMTDWFGGHDPIAQQNAGNDLLMPGNLNQAREIINGVDSGKITMAQLDQNVGHILKLILKSPEFHHYKYSNHPDLKAHAQVARYAADDGMVLLKNENNTLPFHGVKTIAVFGNTSHDLIAGGTGSGNVNKPFVINLVPGLKNAGYQTIGSLDSDYRHYIYTAEAARPRPRSFFMLPPPIPEMIISPDEASQIAGESDIAVITIGRNAGEGADRKITDNYYLTDREKDLIRTVTSAFHAQNKKVVVVLNIGGVTDVAAWRDEPDAILLAWQPSEEAGNAIADILSGKVDPSGKLATTFPMDYNDVPSAKSFPGVPADHPKEVTYSEGIYVGYRYYSTFNVKPAYAFGYGLSYTDFSFSPVTLSSHHFTTSVTATVTITNTGKRAGKEVAELYLSAPSGGLDKPAIELKAFGKTRTLQPGEKQTMSFVLHPGDLASFDTGSSSWVAAAGDYTVRVGGSSDELTRQANFSLSRDLVTEKDQPEMTPESPIVELKK